MVNEYQNALRLLVSRATRRGTLYGLRPYQIQSDEIGDPSLVSLRLYGTRKYITEIKVICGVSYAHELLPEKSFYFPVLRDILQLRKKYGIK